MSDQFKGEVYVTSDIDKDRFENAALLCGFAVAVQPLGGGCYKLIFYTTKESAK